MSMQARPWPQVPELTAAVAQAAFPKGCLAMRVRDELGMLFADEEFASAFGRRGRPGISPGQLALVSVMQFAENLTDRQAAHAVRSRIDWKYLLGLELSDAGFDFTVLSGFRDRLLHHGLEMKVLDVMLAKLAERGLVASGGRQRSDSTHVLGAVRILNRLEFVGETLRAGLEALAAAAPQWLIAHVEPRWIEEYGSRTEAYRLPREEDERAALARRIGADGYRLLEAVHSVDAPRWLRQISAVDTLRTVWIQQFQRTTGTDGGREVIWRKGDDLPPGRDLVSSPYDVQARYAIKRGSSWTGYKVHLTETCDGPALGRPHLITNVVTTDATVPDVQVTEQIHADLHARRMLPGEHVVDAGYTSAGLLVASARDHGVTLLGPVRPDTTRQAGLAAGYGVSAFTIDWDARQATCPQGQASRYWTEGRDKGGLPAIRIRFAAATCHPCPSREQCTSSLRYGRQLTIRPRQEHQVLQQIRVDQATDEWQMRYAVRSGVEGTIHQAVATTGARRTRYIGLAKTRLAHVFTAAAINMIRLDAWWTAAPLARTRISHLAALDLALTA
ncbi:IS1182 family transposase [Nonomuraea sp. NPDC049400]|uniref:IS1182 family transposase n=1 Tax=Nonomuraea sp. NPDC049400 TaxID=3364352 RepID=UPI003790ADE4